MAQLHVKDGRLLTMTASASTPRLIPPGRAVRCAAVVLGATAILIAACRDGPAPTPDATSPAPSPTSAPPTPAPPDAAVGHELQRNGEYDEAIAVYQEVIARSPEPARPLAQLSLARTYLLNGQHLEARDELENVLAQAGSDSDRRVAQFLLGEAQEALGDLEGALEHYGSFAEEGSAAAPYADLARARLLASLGRSQEAAEAADSALSAGLPPVVAAGALLDMAGAFESGGTLDDAIAWYERLFEETTSDADRALARWRIGVLSRLRGDPDWADHHLAVIADYPSAPASLDALLYLEEAGVSVDGYLAGLVYYRHLQDSEAQATLEEYLEQDPPGPHDAEAAYYLAAVHERRGDEEAALDAYADSLARDPDGPVADDAAWWRARLLEDLGRYSSAKSAYEALPRRYPRSPWASEAPFRAGLLLYKEGRYDEAISAFRSARSLADDADDVARSRLWLAKAERGAGHSGEALTILQELAETDPDGYYGLRAAALLGRPAPSAQPDQVDLTDAPAIDWTAIDAWAASWLPSDLSGASRAFLNDPRWLRAKELLDLQLLDEASLELQSLLEAHGTTSPALLALARAVQPLGVTRLSAQAASRLLAALPEAAADAAPPDLLRLAYPIDFASPIQTTAERTDTSPLVLLAVIRQESLFDPRAGSSAGALGLTQVIPSTAEEIAADLGLEEDVSELDLLRPTVNIRFGAHYLSEQLDAFDGRLAPALAAYNGGPGNASRWLGRGEDEDLFLEEISFAQTKAYVRLVSENLAAYSSLYGSAKTP